MFTGDEMKYLLLLACLIGSSSFAADVYVQPHTTKDGTYVSGHYKTAPDSTKTNNYSSEGNVNPYTGKSGTVDPYAPSKNAPPPVYSAPKKTCIKDSYGNTSCY
jgi:hypothetical protein